MRGRRSWRRRALGGLAVVAVAASSGCGGGGEAVQFGDRSISHDELLDMAAAWTANEDFQRIFNADEFGNAIAFEPGAAAGSYSQDLVSSLIESRIVFGLIRDEFELQGLEVSASHETTVSQELGAIVAQFSDEELQEQTTTEFEEYLALSEALGPSYSTWLEGALRELDVEISSRYGHWDPETLSVVPPDGPVTPADDDLQPFELDPTAGG